MYRPFYVAYLPDHASHSYANFASVYYSTSWDVREEPSLRFMRSHFNPHDRQEYSSSWATVVGSRWAILSRWMHLCSAILWFCRRQITLGSHIFISCTHSIFWAESKPEVLVLPQRSLDYGPGSWHSWRKIVHWLVSRRSTLPASDILDSICHWKVRISGLYRISGSQATADLLLFSATNP